MNVQQRRVATSCSIISNSTVTEQAVQLTANVLLARESQLETTYLHSAAKTSGPSNKERWPGPPHKEDGHQLSQWNQTQQQPNKLQLNHRF